MGRAKAETASARIKKALRALLREHRATLRDRERRDQPRIDFIQPVKVRTHDGKVLHLLSRDLSTTGIRLLGTHALLGQKVEVELPSAKDAESLRLTARVLWTCAVGDELFENGGMFLEMDG